MCSAQKSKRERIELPAQPGEKTKRHCPFCLAPPLQSPLAMPRIDAPANSPLLVLEPRASQLPQSPLVRAQVARAPPHA